VENHILTTMTIISRTTLKNAADIGNAKIGGEKMADIKIDTGKCDDCGDCTDVCPMEVLILKDGKLTIHEPDECSYCETCVDICPNECITIE
jgi:NAD-dependent dihydropyrimidine dehydrogenase PreA subunit